MKLARIETAVRVVLAFNKAFNARDVAAMLKLVTDDCVFEESGPAPDGVTITGKAALRTHLEALFATRPSLHIQGEDVFGLGFRAVMRWRAEWVDGAGETHHLRGVDVYHLRQGVICNRFSYVKGA